MSQDRQRDCRSILLVEFGRSMVNTRKGGTESQTMIDNESRSTKILKPQWRQCLLNHLISILETRHKQGEEIRTLMEDIMQN